MCNLLTMSGINEHVVAHFCVRSLTSVQEMPVALSLFLRPFTHFSDDETGMILHSLSPKVQTLNKVF